MYIFILYACLNNNNDATCVAWWLIVITTKIRLILDTYGAFNALSINIGFLLLFYF